MIDFPSCLSSKYIAYCLNLAAISYSASLELVHFVNLNVHYLNPVYVLALLHAEDPV
jgi:hypothetical protein